MIDLNKLAAEIHAAAVEKGFWDVEEAGEKHVAKMHSELSEAVQEDRCGHPLLYVDDIDVMDRITDPAQFDGRKPEGVAAELADFVMMTLDLIETAGIVDEVLECIPVADETIEEMKIHTLSLPTIAVGLHTFVCNIVSDAPVDDKYIYAATMIAIPDAWLHARGYDLLEIIRQKMEYNKHNRGYLHGRAY